MPGQIQQQTSGHAVTSSSYDTIRINAKDVSPQKLLAILERSLPETSSLSKCSKIYTPYDGTGTLLDVGCDNILFRAKRLPTTFRKAPHTNEHTKPTNHYS
ncbi:hypothetical protein NW765_016647 [Fusarium oxysporum]|nr:hypothetical protein NW765_016647 [Fusarium oxysporum]